MCYSPFSWKYSCGFKNIIQKYYKWASLFSTYFNNRHKHKTAANKWKCHSCFKCQNSFSMDELRSDKNIFILANNHNKVHMLYFTNYASKSNISYFKYIHTHICIKLCFIFWELYLCKGKSVMHAHTCTHTNTLTAWC